MDASEHYAAVDLGSNSFHMLVARRAGSELRILDRLRERVGLAEGLQPDLRLSEEVFARAVACLERFGQRLREFPSARVRAVGTNTLRQARPSGAVLPRLEAALGHTIEVLPGPEEARLVYLGIAHDRHDEAKRRLAIDIGGGSTEVIVGEGFEPLRVDSLHMGCVSWSARHFPEGRLSSKRMAAARIAAEIELEPIVGRVTELGWDLALGSSGTIRSIERIVAAAGWCARGIDRPSLERLERAVVAARRVEQLSVAGLAEDRRPVLAGGLAILVAVFDRLGVTLLEAADGALREGVLVDLIGREHASDAREDTVRAWARRYEVDQQHAARVENTAVELWRQCAEQQGAQETETPEETERLLRWAARLHEIGLAIAFAGHHKHGSYLLANGVMPGFSRQDQEFLGALVRGHRGRFADELFSALGPSRALLARRLTLLLRIAVRLHRGRGAAPLPVPRLDLERRGVRLGFPDGWLDEHPLTRADLAEEAAGLSAAGVTLTVR